MFERATIFSAILAFVMFGMVGVKYFNFLENKNQVTKTSITTEQ